MARVPQGTGFATMPRGLAAEISMERFEDWSAAREGDRAYLAWPTKRVSLSGGPFADWAWDTTLLPDLFVADGGRYLPTLTTYEDGVYLWVPDELPAILPSGRLRGWAGGNE